MRHSTPEALDGASSVGVELGRILAAGRRPELLEAHLHRGRLGDVIFGAGICES